MENNKDLMSRLKFISRIQPSEKLSIRELEAHPDNVINNVWRWIFRENSRNKTLSFLNETVAKSFEVIRNYSRSVKVSDQIIVSSVLEDLRASRQGLINLKETYNTDRKFVCDIDILLLLIEANLLELDPTINVSSDPRTECKNPDIVEY